MGCKLGYRPALDGLRGFAVLIVLGSHFDVPLLWNGGGVGVGIFFALSGFLITSLLLEERQRTGRVNLWAFYGRRARRLLPALYVVVAFWLAATWALGAFDTQWAGILTASTYVTNWALVYGVETGAMHHTWSLAVEEQFYAFWPLAIILAGLTWIVWRWAGMALGLGVMLILGQPGIALLAGCLLSVGLHRGMRLAAPWWTGALGLGAIMFLTIAPFGWTLGMGVTGIVGAVILASVSGGENRLTRALSFRPLRGAGRISYALYLWHPVLIGTAIIAGFDKGPVVNVVLIGLTFAAALASWRWVESPWLVSKRSDAGVEGRVAGVRAVHPHRPQPGHVAARHKGPDVLPS